MLVEGFLTFLILIFKAQSQLYGPGPLYPGSWSIDPNLCGPCGPEIGPYGPYGDPYPTIPACLPNISPVQPIITAPTIPCVQPVFNSLPTPSFIQNQIPCSNLINQPVITNPVPSCSQPIFSQPQLTPVINTAPCTTAPPVVTTVVDNTLANSLANAIQLLIVSNLIENTLGSSSGCGGNILAQALGLIDTPCISNFELVSPDFYPTAQVISCNRPEVYNPCYQDPVVFQSPCDPCASFGPSFPVIGDCNKINFDSCGSNPLYAIEPCCNQFGSSVIPSYGCLEPTVPTIAPMAVEVPFPASIPAQMVCNFGYLPTNVPCVSVNVEPLPFDTFNNLFGNFNNYIC